MKRLILIGWALSIVGLPACVHSLSMGSSDGEKLSGRYRFADETTGLIQVIGDNGEVLAGKFTTVGRGTFVENYRSTFGSGSIIAEGPDVSNHFGGILGGSYALPDSAYGQSPDTGSGNSKTEVKGPLFYWIAPLRGEKGTAMTCYFIGSSYTGHGFGRCKHQTGKEYAVEF